MTSIPHAFAGDLSAKRKLRANNAAKVLTLMTRDPLKDPKNEKVMKEMEDDDSDKSDVKPSHVALALKWVDASFPSTILLSSTCMAVIPGEKTISAGLGGSYGAGVATCRTDGNSWSKPVYVKLTGGEIGSVGVEKTDLVLVFGSDRSAQIL